MAYRYPTAFSKWDHREREAMDAVIASEHFTMGPRVAYFEKVFAEFHDKKHGIMVNSGSSANLIAVAALAEIGSFKPGDVVAVPAIAWSTTYAPLVQYGLRIHLLDVDDTWNAPPASVPFATRLMIGCSILGNPAYLAEWQDLAKSREVRMIEDNCESFSAFVASNAGIRLCGTFGDLSTFSFFYSHQISGIEGGMILTDDDSLADNCRILRAHGWIRDIYKAKKFDDEYKFVAMGYNVRPLEIHAAVSEVQLTKTDEFRTARMTNYNYFDEKTRELPITLQKQRGLMNPFGLAFLVPSNEQRAALAIALRAAGVDCRLPTGGSFRKHPYGRVYEKQRTPNADMIHERGMFLGNAPYDIRDLIDIAVGVMKEFFHG